MELIEAYILEVTRRLPEKKRQEAEKELRVTIAEMLPEDCSEEETKAALEKLGSPVIVASRFHKQPLYLIGPRYFDVYVTYVKKIVPIAAALAFIFGLIDSLTDYSSGQELIKLVIKSFMNGFGSAFDVAVQVVVWVTIIFAIMERTNKEKSEQPLTTKFKEWTVNDLKAVKAAPEKKAISKSEVIWGAIWIVVWANMYYYANHWIGIYEENGNGLTFVTAVFNQKVLFHYWYSIVIIIGLEVALILFKIIKGHWTKSLAIYNAVVEVISSIVFIVILVNPHLLNRSFVTYASQHWSVPSNQLVSGFVITGIFIFVISAVFNSFDGFRKASMG